MHLLHLGPAGDTFAGTLGVAAALLLLGGPLLLRWQRTQKQFTFMHAALAQGITDFPKGPPWWLLSLRQGIMTLTLGVALLIVGGAGLLATRGIADSSVNAGHRDAQPMQLPAASDGPSGYFHPIPPAPNPALEEWHRLQAINTLGLATTGVGFVSTLLGIVRVAFSRTEKKYYIVDQNIGQRC